MHKMEIWVNVNAGGLSRIQLPKSVRTMKKMEKIIPLSFTPPWDLMPSYMTTFQSSPVRICKEKNKKEDVIMGQETL